MNVQHIGRVPRFNPMVLAPDHPLVDQFNRPTTWDEEGCDELVPWTPPYLMLGNALQFYVREHLVAEGRDPRRITPVARHAFRIWGPEIDVSKLDRAAVRHYTTTRQSEGAKGATTRRELSLIQAALAHNVREERLEKSPKFVKPPPGPCRLRWLTRDEYRTLMQQPMERRIKLFLLIAFGAGARSKAIEELEWNRIDWQARTVDFRVPNTVYRNKRRVVAPLGDVLYTRLESAYQRRDPGDPFVIGRGGCTFRKVKKTLALMGIVEEGVCRHVARHTFCSWLVQAGASYAHVGRLVGDKASMIESTYGHLSPEHVRAAANLALLAA
jgi:integrase